MEDSITKTQKNSNMMKSNSNRSGEVVRELDISRRAYEIYKEKSINFSDELWELVRGRQTA
jgi:ACT domain-containing protein